MISKFCFKTYFYFLLTGLVFFMIFPVIFKNDGRLVGTFYLTYYYCLGAFFRNYYKSSDREMIYLIGGIFTYLLIVMFSFIFNQNRVSYYTSFSDINSIFIVLCSIFVFLFFLCQKKFSCNKFLLFCSNSTFGVYFFHEHFLDKEILWKILGTAGQRTSTYNGMVMTVGIKWMDSTTSTFLAWTIFGVGMLILH